MSAASATEQGDRTRILVRSITAADGGTVLAAGDGPGDEVFRCRVPVRPDAPSARRWQRVMRRIHRVEIDGRSGCLQAMVWGVGHRREVRLPVPVGTALGLGLAGVPLVLDLGGS
ncbi:MAG: hypothetical protein R2761_26135 [Acidimicrobiales bacterium]